MQPCHIRHCTSERWPTLRNGHRKDTCWKCKYCILHATVKYGPGLIFRITYVRETRLAAIIANGLILLSALFMLPVPLNFIPRPVLDGLFLYMAVTSVHGNEMFERVLLLLTEQVWKSVSFIMSIEAFTPPPRYITEYTQCTTIISLIERLYPGYNDSTQRYNEYIFDVTVITGV